MTRHLTWNCYILKYLTKSRRPSEGLSSTHLNSIYPGLISDCSYISMRSTPRKSKRSSEVLEPPMVCARTLVIFALPATTSAGLQISICMQSDTTSVLLHSLLNSVNHSSSDSPSSLIITNYEHLTFFLTVHSATIKDQYILLFLEQCAIDSQCAERYNVRSIGLVYVRSSMNMYLNCGSRFVAILESRSDTDCNCLATRLRPG